MRKVSHLKALHAFELTARLGSYSSAAQEMGVTAAAVGQLVRGLEAALGQQLFHRSTASAQRLEPTATAAMALPMLTRAFDLIDLAYSELRSKPSKDRVILTASHAIVAHQVLPRLADFTEAHPNVDVVLNVSDNLIDLAKGEADLAIRCGSGHWDHLEKTRIQDEVMVVVCAPRLLTTERADEAWLSRQTLIDDTTPASMGRLPTWEEWLTSTGFSERGSKPRLAINAPSAILAAAENGQGVALVRSALAKQMLTSGKLVNPFPNVLCPTDWSYYLVSTSQARQRSAVSALHDWLLQAWQVD